MADARDAIAAKERHLLAARAYTPRDLAALAAGTEWSRTPSHVRDIASKLTLQMVAGAIAGYSEPFCARQRHDLMGGSESRTRRRIPAEHAAYLAALPLTVIQIDEGHRQTRGQPGIHVVPAALAVAAELDAAGDQLLGAVVAGYEVAVRVALQIGPLPEAVHPHGSWGTFGAAIAAGRLWGLDAAALENVIEGVAAVPLYPWRGTLLPGASIHYTYAAAGAAMGVSIARAVKNGASAQPGAFSDYYLPSLGAPQPGPLSFAEYEVANAYLKYYPSCAHIHTAAETLTDLVGTHQIRAEDVTEIHVFGYRGLVELDSRRPRTNLAARFSVPFCLARILRFGEIGDQVFSTEELRDPATLAIVDRVNLTLDRALDQQYPAARPVRLVVKLASEAVLTGERAVARGEPSRTEPLDEWQARVRRLIGDARSESLLSFLGADPSGWSARELAGLVGL